MTISTPCLELELENYFRTNVGPIFCQPSAELLRRYPLVKGLVGMVVPCHNSGLKALYKIDWSLNKDWHRIRNAYPNFESLWNQFEDFIILQPAVGEVIPQLVDEAFYDFDWHHITNHDTVCISSLYYHNLDVTTKSFAHKVGIVSDKLIGPETTLILVEFPTGTNTTTIRNIEKKHLIRLPPKYRPEMPTKSVTTQKPTPKYKVGQVVKITASAISDVYHGLLGIVKEVFSIPKEIQYFCSESFDYEYLVDFNILPNRNLSLTFEENDNEICYVSPRFKQYEIEEWNEKISDKTFCMVYRTIRNRRNVWVIPRKEVGTVDYLSSSKKSIDTGIEVSVKLGSSLCIKTTCRQIDYNWDKDKLLKAIANKNHIITVGIEDITHNNPNENIINIYLFIFDKDARDIVKYRILLGTLKDSKSNIKKFGQALMNNKFIHPWQISRYLNSQSTGRLYSLLTANEFVETGNKIVGVK